jgi:hypothetical protein
MAEYFYQGQTPFEVELMFSTYSFKFYSQQNFMRAAPISALYFQRFVYLNEYPMICLIPMIERYIAQLEIPNQVYLSDYQHHFLSTLAQRTSPGGILVAELIDENADYIYLIFDQNDNMSVPRFNSGRTLEVFQFGYNELMQLSQNALTYLRNLQLSQIFLTKQYQETNIFYEFFKQHASSWQFQALTQDLQLDRKIEEVQKRNTPVKTVQKVAVKLELGSSECLLCCTNPKSIVFLPCGHVVACKECTTQNLEIVLSKVINQRRSPRSCPICKQAIKEAREVFI